MTGDSELQDVLDGLVGLECRQVINSVGSVLVIDLGAPGRGSHQREDAKPTGWRSLLIVCPWRLQRSTGVLCDWNAESSRGGELAACVARMVGQVVASAQVSPPAGDLTLSFADDLQLAVFSDGDIDRGYAWTMLGTDGLELAAGTRFGAQGYRLAWRSQG
jgi:hypothetical protein